MTLEEIRKTMEDAPVRHPDLDGEQLTLLALGKARQQAAREMFWSDYPAPPTAPAQPLFGTWCRCGAGVPMCGTHAAAPWILRDGTWYCSRACLP